MMAFAFCIGLWLGRYMDGTVQPMAYGVWFWSALLALTSWTLIQRYGGSGIEHPTPGAQTTAPATAPATAPVNPMPAKP